MIQIGLEVHIDAPRERVWEILADHESMPRWFPAREVIRRTLERALSGLKREAELC